MFDTYKNYDSQDQDFILWMQSSYINYVSLFILFFGLGYAFDIVFLLLSIITILILQFFKIINISNKYILQQPTILWLAVFIPYMIMFDDTNHYYIFFPFGWVFDSNFIKQDYGIYQILQQQIETEFLITAFLVIYIGGILEIKYYNKIKKIFDFITLRFKKKYICFELSKKLPNQEDILHGLVYEGNIKKISEFLNPEIQGVSKAGIVQRELYKKDKYGRPPILLARASEVIDFFLSRGVDIDTINSYNGQTLLHLASQKGDLSLVKFLLKNQADINKKDIMKRTPVDYSKNYKMRNFLIEEGGKETILYNKIRYYILKTIQKNLVK